jgi:actin-related protein
MFEVYEVPGLSFANQNLLSFLSTGRLTGVSLNLGAGSSSVLPIYEGCSMKFAQEKAVENSGHELTKHLIYLLSKKGYESWVNFGCQRIGCSEFKAAQTIKEKLCFVSMDFDVEMKKLESSYESAVFSLPDGQSVFLGKEQVECPELLFSTKGGIHKLVHDSISKCDKELRRALYENILVSGGSAAFKNLTRRIRKNVLNLSSEDVQPRVFLVEDFLNSTWKGGSIISSMADFQARNFIFRDMYYECGYSIVHRFAL